MLLRPIRQTLTRALCSSTATPLAWKGVSMEHSALANPLVMQAAATLRAALSEVKIIKDGAGVQVGDLGAFKVGVRTIVTLPLGDSDSAAVLALSLLEHHPRNWRLLAATGIRDGEQYRVELAGDDDCIRLRLHLERNSSSGPGGFGGSTRVVLETPSLSDALARTVADALADGNSRTTFTGEALRAFEDRITPLVPGMPDMPNPPARREKQVLNPGMVLVPWEGRDQISDVDVADRLRADFRSGEEHDAVMARAGDPTSLSTRLESVVAGLTARLDALDAAVATAAAKDSEAGPSNARGKSHGSSALPRWGEGGGYDAFTSPEQAVDFLAELGAKVVWPMPHSAVAARDADAAWAVLAGSGSLRLQVEESLVLPMRYPEALQTITAGTRASTNEAADGGGAGGASSALPRPPSLLFYGPPGTGKTTAARLAAEEALLPLIYCPLESLVSKWVGQGEQQLASLFAASSALGRGCIIFLDELDALAGSREGDLHEASRRMLSVLLRRMDGLDACEQTALIGATNRPQDLDSALLSRFDVRILFDSPDSAARTQIFARYAKQVRL